MQRTRQYCTNVGILLLVYFVATSVDCGGKHSATHTATSANTDSDTMLLRLLLLCVGKQLSIDVGAQESAIGGRLH